MLHWICALFILKNITIGIQYLKLSQCILFYSKLVATAQEHPAMRIVRYDYGNEQKCMLL